tara:strand:- start:77 stop:418 length:342 start_codon:yes stop_codon:yes gene_type:complete
MSPNEMLEDGEIFQLLGCTFDITKAMRMISRDEVVEKGQIETKDIWKWINVIKVDEDYASQITKEQLQTPVIVAKFVDEDLLVDGYHRLAKAMSMNLEKLPFVSINAHDILIK